MTWRAFETLRVDATAPLVLICDHAANAVPPEYRNLGLPQSELDRHIGYDIGAAAITRLLSARFGAAAVLAGTSRLVIDCNRNFTNPTLIPEVSDRTDVPANVGLAASGAAGADRPLFRALSPRRRPDGGAGDRRWPPAAGRLHSLDDRPHGRHPPALADRACRRPVIGAWPIRYWRRCGGTTGSPSATTNPTAWIRAQDYSIARHALIHALDYVQVEFRQDEVATAEGQAAYANIFAEALAASGVLSGR